MLVLVCLLVSWPVHSVPGLVCQGLGAGGSQKGRHDVGVWVGVCECVSVCVSVCVVVCQVVGECGAEKGRHDVCVCVCVCECVSVCVCVCVCVYLLSPSCRRARVGVWSNVCGRSSSGAPLRQPPPSL